MTSCAVCDAFASQEGFYSVTIDCLTSSRNASFGVTGIPVDSFLLHDENWMKNVLPGCLAKLISSLGMSRPASFFRHGLPTNTYMHTPGVVVGKTGAVVTGAYAMDAGFWPTSAGGQLNEHPLCENESTHARDRFAAYNESCTWDFSKETCRSSGVDSMAEQQQAYLQAYNAARAAGSRCIDKSTNDKQISLRYGIDNVAGVLFTEKEHAPVAHKLAVWLRELTGRDIPLISLVEAGTCECTAVAPADHPLQLARLDAPEISDKSSCVQRCGEKGQPECCTRQCTAPLVDTIAHDHRWHGVLMRIPLTGAAAIDCATAGLEQQGLWTNLGGQMTSFKEVQNCMSGCRRLALEHVAPTLILTVRNPYDYWWAFFSTTTAPSKSSKTSFCTFMHSTAAASATWISTTSQSGQIRRICGEPCNYQFLLHAETFNADYLSLLAHLSLPVMQGLPRQALDSFDLSANRALEYTPKMATMVQDWEELLFEPRFGYSRHF